MTNKPTRMPEQPKSMIADVAGTVLKAASEFYPGTGTLFGLIGDYGERLKQKIQEENEASLNSFFRELTAGTSQLDPSVAQAMFDDRDFHSLVRACVADIEDEKREAYASLAITIAMGAVAKEWTRHFIISLKDISISELNILRVAYVAKHFKLQQKEHVGGQSVYESSFLKAGQPGSTQSISINNLTNRGFVFDEKLSRTGEAFVSACTSKNRLSPSALEYKEWSGQFVPVVCYELDNELISSLALKVEQALWKYQIKSQVLAITEPTTRQPATLMFTQAVLLIGGKESGISKYAKALGDFSEKRAVVGAYVTSQATVLPNEVKLSKVIGYESDFEQTLQKLITAILDFRNPAPG